MIDNLVYHKVWARFTIGASFLSLGFLFVYSFYNGWTWLLMSFVYYKIVVGLVGNQIGQHRYFSHKSFETTPFKSRLLLIATLTTGISALAYASIHRHHHAHSDKERDPHSPNKGFFNSFIGWSFGNTMLKIKPAYDLIRMPWVLNLHRHLYHIIWITVIALCYIDWKLAVFILLSGVAWNYIHMGLFRTSLAHTKIPFSYKSFYSNDNSYNNKFIHYFDLGEGLHNNHHAYPSRYDQALRDDEFDPAGWVVKKVFL
jgi:stearoyl-CoA desaturase (delta-9 desaturase)